MDDLIKLYWLEKSNLAQAMAIPEFLEPVHQLAKEVIYTYGSGGRVFIMANGGPAGAADGFAQDLRTNPFVADDKSITLPGHVARLQAYSLNDAGMITGIGNDLGFEKVFTEQLRTFALTTEDIVIGLSGSGNSPNILNAFKYALECRTMTCCISGRGGGEAKKLVEISIDIPGTSVFPGQAGGSNDNNFHIEDFQVSISHIITGLLKKHVQDNAA